jgi:hypothetical protein
MKGQSKNYFQIINWIPKFINAVRRDDKGLVMLQRTDSTRAPRRN